MVESPTLVWVFLPRIRWLATPRYQVPASYSASASKPSILALAIFWYWKNCENRPGTGTRIAVLGVDPTRSI
jgi:hypothetical protein